jgi:hypothetical protein
VIILEEKALYTLPSGACHKRLRLQDGSGWVDYEDASDGTPVLEVARDLVEYT